MHILLDPDESYSLFKNGGFYLLIKGLSSGDKALRGVLLNSIIALCLISVLIWLLSSQEEIKKMIYSGKRKLNLVYLALAFTS